MRGNSRRHALAPPMRLRTTHCKPVSQRARCKKKSHVWAENCRPPSRQPRGCAYRGTLAWPCTALAWKNSPSRPGRCVSQRDVHSTRRRLHTIAAAAHSARLCNLLWLLGIVQPTTMGTRFLLPALKMTLTRPVSVVGRLTNLVCAAQPQRLNTSGWETQRWLQQSA